MDTLPCGGPTTTPWPSTCRLTRLNSASSREATGATLTENTLPAGWVGGWAGGWVRCGGACDGKGVQAARRRAPLALPHPPLRPHAYPRTPAPLHPPPHPPVSVDRSVSSMSTGTSLPPCALNSTTRPLRHLSPGQRDRSRPLMYLRAGWGRGGAGWAGCVHPGGGRPGRRRATSGHGGAAGSARPARSPCALPPPPPRPRKPRASGAAAQTAPASARAASS